MHPAFSAHSPPWIQENRTPDDSPDHALHPQDQSDPALRSGSVRTRVAEQAASAPPFGEAHGYSTPQASTHPGQGERAVPERSWTPEKHAGNADRKREIPGEPGLRLRADRRRTSAKVLDCDSSSRDWPPSASESSSSQADRAQARTMARPACRAARSESSVHGRASRGGREDMSRPPPRPREMSRRPRRPACHQCSLQTG